MSCNKQLQVTISCGKSAHKTHVCVHKSVLCVHIYGLVCTFPPFVRMNLSREIVVSRDFVT